MKRVRGAQYRDLLGRRRSQTLRGLMTVHLTKGLPAPPRDWSECQEPWEPEDDAAPAATGSPYGIDPGVQRALAELRTDLDAFSDDEAYALMAAGYRMTACELAGAVPRLADPDPRLEVQWPFAGALAEMMSPDPSRLAASLRAGHSMFLRRPKVWLHRLGARPSGLRTGNGRRGR
jgi:hypothetical protein